MVAPVALLLLAGSALAAPRHTPTYSAAVAASTGASSQSSGSSVSKQGNLWVVPETGSFAHQAIFDFKSLSALPEGLAVSPDHIGKSGDAKYTQDYTAANVKVNGGALKMTVPGGQTGPSIQGAEIATKAKLLYGSVRTTAKIGAAKGVCSGFFSYNNANAEESDIEILTANMTRIHYTNQDPSGKGPSSTVEGPMPEDATTAFHEYRTDWIDGRVIFYLDGKRQAEIDKHAPTVATPWVWNNWANGGSWSAGPPEQDNVLEISKIEMYYNTTA